MLSEGIERPPVRLVRNWLDANAHHMAGAMARLHKSAFGGFIGGIGGDSGSG